MKDAIPADGIAQRASGDGVNDRLDGERRQLRLLVVDSDPRSCPSVARAIRGSASVVIGRPDATSAMETVRQQSFDVIVVRLDESSIDGTQLLQMLAQLGIQEHILVVAANTDDINAARSLGMHESLSPSCHAGELRAAIARCAESA
jgi:DNA-binding NtrC family response regulator